MMPMTTAESTPESNPDLSGEAIQDLKDMVRASKAHQAWWQVSINYRVVLKPS